MIPSMPRKWPVWLERWLERHQNPVSLLLHLVGIPLATLAVLLAAVQLYRWQWLLWWQSAALLAVGYGLQWIGHRIEGNDMGEVILIKRLLGKPYKAVSPRYGGGDPPVTGPGHALFKRPH